MTQDGGGKFRMQVSQNGVDMAGAGTIDIFCVDYLNGTYIPGSIYDAAFTNLSSASFVSGYLQNTRYGRDASRWNSGTDALMPIVFQNSVFGSLSNPTVLDRYRMAGLLATQYQLGNNSLNTTINRAIWQLTAVTPPPGESYPWGTYPTDGNMSTWTTWAGNRLTEMYNTMSLGDLDAYFGNFQVVTQTGPLYLAGQIPSQEFLTITPEPSFFVMLLVGVSVLMVVAKRRTTSEVRL